MIRSRIRDALSERVANSRERCKDIGLLRKAILAEYVSKSPFILVFEQ